MSVLGFQVLCTGPRNGLKRNETIRDSLAENNVQSPWGLLLLTIDVYNHPFEIDTLINYGEQLITWIEVFL